MAFGVNVRTIIYAAAAVAALTSVDASDFQLTAAGSNAAAEPAADTTSAPPAAADTPAANDAPTTTPATKPAKPAASTGASTGSSSDPAPDTSSASSPSVKGWPNPIVVKGNKFFDSVTGLEFRMKGMAYYPRPNAGELSTANNYDWATDDHEAVWKPHIEIMKSLGVNTIRLYSVDPSKSHDKFMCAAASAGIYVLIGMAAPCENCAILDLKPPACYPDELFTRIQMVYNAFAVYDNVLGFSVGNENNLLRKFVDGGTQTMPCAKALLRDARNYAASCAGHARVVPIGLDLADILPREQWLTYMDCAIDDNEFGRAEWLGFNPYVECDPATHLEYSQSKGLQNLMAAYEKVKYPRPLMFGEFGCNLGENTVGGYENQRAFYDAKWMNEEKDMTDQIVGGNVFEFVTEIPNTVAKALTKTADPGRYGIGYFDPLTCDHDTVPCVFKKYPEFDNLKKAYTSTKASTLNMKDYTITRKDVLACPSNITSTIPPMPKVKTLECANLQPVCSGVKSNNGKKPTKVAKLGDKASPSNTDSPGAGSNNANGVMITVAASIVSLIASSFLL